MADLNDDDDDNFRQHILSDHVDRQSQVDAPDPLRPINQVFDDPTILSGVTLQAEARPTNLCQEDDPSRNASQEQKSFLLENPINEEAIVENGVSDAELVVSKLVLFENTDLSSTHPSQDLQNQDAGDSTSKETDLKKKQAMEEGRSDRSEQQLSSSEQDGIRSIIHNELGEASTSQVPTPPPPPDRSRPVTSCPGAFRQRPGWRSDASLQRIDSRGSIIWGDGANTNVSPSPRPVVSNSDLVQARPITLPTETAEPVMDIAQSSSSKRENTTHQKGLLLAGILFVVCLITVGLILFLVVRDKSSDPTSPPIGFDRANETAQSGSTGLEHLSWELPFPLPNSTLQTILFDQQSPQYKAYDWTRIDPYRETYSRDRLQQRFAMVMFYYATEGDLWKHQGGGTVSFKDDNGEGKTELINITSEPWLSYESSECQWYSTAEARSGYPACTDNNTLENLILLDNDIKGTLPEELSLLTSLKRIDFTRNGIGGTIPTSLGTLTNLKKLTLHRNGVVGPVPSQLGLLSKLTKLGFIKNELTGRLPLEIWQMSELEELDLSDNDISGSLPSDMGEHLPNLEILQMSRTLFTGSLPTSIGLMLDLKDLLLHKNQFTGFLPSELGLLPHLKKLFAPENQFSGTLPPQLSQLDIANFMGNQNLTGPIPVEWVNVTILKLESTSITGTIPEGLCEIEKLEFDCSPMLCGCDCKCGNLTVP